MTDEESPRPFRRERNLSNRNFRRRGSSRRFSTESHSSVESFSTNTETESSNTTATNTSLISSSSSTPTDAFQYSYSVNSDSENAFNQKSLLKIQQGEELRLQRPDSIESAPDPALLGVKQKVLRFETLKAHERIIFKTGKFNSRFNISGSQTLGPLRVLPTINSSVPDSPTSCTPTATTPDQPSTSTIPRRQISSLYKSIDEARSEDEVDDIACDDVDGETVPAGEYVLADDVDAVRSADADKAWVPHITIDDFGQVETQSNHATEEEGSGAQDVVENSENSSENGVQGSTIAVGKKGTKDFPRNYRSTPRPKTQIVGTTNRHLIGKYNSVYQPKDDEEPEEEEEEIELRDKCFKYIHPILEELINTEETYVESLFNGIKNYGNIFARKDLPLGLRGKKYVLLGNIEQIAEFHRDEFLPMLLRNRRDLKRLFDEFQHFVEQNCFYGYVIFTMNKQKSLKLCEDYKTYFKLLQTELDDKLGINSFLVQPIQRISKYPLLLKEFISTLFKNRDFVMKPIIESCCRLDKKIRTLLTTTNESEVINDIIDCHEFNVFFQGKFRKVSDFNVFDHTLKRSYRGKIFIFDKCIIYTEIKGKSLLFHGRYPCEHIGIVAKTKSFTLFYERRKQQECDFTGDVALIEHWLELIRDMISSYATEERQKLQELYSRESDHMHRKPPSLSLFRDSNRFSSDSGIGNIWVMPKPELGEDALSNRTTWYAVS